MLYNIIYLNKRITTRSLKARWMTCVNLRFSLSSLEQTRTSASKDGGLRRLLGTRRKLLFQVHKFHFRLLIRPHFRRSVRSAAKCSSHLWSHGSYFSSYRKSSGSRCSNGHGDELTVRFATTKSCWQRRKRVHPQSWGSRRRRWSSQSGQHDAIVLASVLAGLKLAANEPIWPQPRHGKPAESRIQPGLLAGHGLQPGRRREPGRPVGTQPARLAQSGHDLSRRTRIFWGHRLFSDLESQIMIPVGKVPRKLN